MPDKQIVIKLNDEQFETIMRLALAAGYASLDEFAKDRLKATLQRESPANNEDSASAEAEKQIDEASLNIAASELRRIHQELRVFIREAASDADKLGAFAFPEGLMAGSKVDEWEELADRAFSKSPQLGNQLENALLPPGKRSLPKESTSQQSKQTEQKSFAPPEDEDEDEETKTSTPDGFSDLSGGPPPRKRSK